MNGKEVLKKLEQQGWSILRIRGSHYRLGKKQMRVTVPIHGARDLGKGLISAIQKQTAVKLV
jgi:predicted RNA binding protein YcfA (HicA-like mRNA interferase family)